MRLRNKLLLAQVPLAIGLAIVGAISASVTSRLADQSRLILADNYRSVLAAQRMKESLERIDSNVLYILAGHEGDAITKIASYRESFERELAVQEGNITERGETEPTRALRSAWNAYARAVGGYLALHAREPREQAYFADLQPRFTRVRQHADEVLALNQDAMVRKSDRVSDRAREFEQLVTGAVILAMIVALLTASWLIARVLRPLGVVSAAVRRFGEGDLRARASVRGGDEIASVAKEFNRMAERLERYRDSSLGELLQAQQAAQATIDGLPDPVLLLDAAGATQGANAAAATLLGVDTEAAGADSLGRADPGVRALVDRLRAHVLGGKGAYVPKGFEDAVRVPMIPGGERIFLPRGTPIYSEAGAVAGAAIVLQDITRLFRFDELKNDLVATVAHEFRTPLTSLRMAIHLCTEETVGPLTAKQADLLFAAREDCERLQVIVDELLNLSRIESGNIDLRRRRTEPDTLVTSAVDSHLAAAAQAGTAIRTELPPGLPEVFVDPDRIQLVFANLLANAIRFSPAGGEIVVRARPEMAKADPHAHRISEPTHVRFEVSDRGPGIASSHQAAVFEKFFRVPGSPEGGSGLGLFIAKGIVQAHGGDIGVASEPDKGATFWFTVPAAPATEHLPARA
jgi:NtrC-family two-component system sensor histidine kinase KinB